ncbi:unnamed protein product [Polarella glacialis]|uniref:Uncharacterized protein n=1 Tax=Polarella glacialis TaxID=89957 RepID=A0A813GCG6_POLGL|nr:unnamed protein product [Polarella glacialis]CAE8622618.1 unnamed protein product [Polarella glacialis]
MTTAAGKLVKGQQQPQEQQPTTTTTTAGLKRKQEVQLVKADSKRSVAAVPGAEEESDCERLKGRVFKNFKTACDHYGFPGSHQVGSYGPKGEGITRTYSNATAGKDKVLNGRRQMLYRLKDDAVRAQFAVNRELKKPVRVFRKVSDGVLDLGLFVVESFVLAGEDDHAAQFGAEFVRFTKASD